MKIADFLSPSDVMLDVAAADKQQLLLELARSAGSKLDILPDRVFSELIRREAFGSTGVGGGVAIPHARFKQIRKPFGMLVRLGKPVDFEAVDEKPVDLVFLLLLPDDAGGEQLGALATIARKLREAARTSSLRAARDAAQMYRTLTID